MSKRSLEVALVSMLVSVSAGCGSGSEGDSGVADGGSGPDSAAPDASATDAGPDANVALPDGGRDGGSDAASPDAGVSGSDYSARGPHPVGNARFTMRDRTFLRNLTVEIWYPAAESARAASDAGGLAAEFVPDSTDALVYASLVDGAPAGCPRRTRRSAQDAAPAAGSFPLVVFSHCHVCTRFSSFSIAERLASHGIAVVAPDHEDNTLFDLLAGRGGGVSDTFLRVRASDVASVLDELLDPSASVVPAALRGRFDASRVGAMGHSYGGATTGYLAQIDARVRAGMSIAAPVDGVLSSQDVAAITQPFLLLLAREDNSIGEGGNVQMRANHAALTPPAWLVQVRDAGHWSFSDLCAVVDLFDPGCGPGLRQTDGTGFTYLDNGVARDLSADYAAAFFAEQLLGDPAGRELLDAPHPSGVVDVAYHP